MTLLANLTAVVEAIGADIKRLNAAMASFAPMFKATLDPVMKSGLVTLDATLLQATFAGGGQAVVLGTLPLSAGKWYFEAKYVSGTTSSNASVGLCRRNEDLAAQVGYDGNGQEVGVFQNSGNIYTDGTNTAAGSSFGTANDVVSVAYDADNRTAWFRTNGQQWNGSATADPATNVGGIAVSGTDPLTAALCSDEAVVFSISFGGGFLYAVPDGFQPWSNSIWPSN